VGSWLSSSQKGKEKARSNYEGIEKTENIVTSLYQTMHPHFKSIHSDHPTSNEGRRTRKDTKQGETDDHSYGMVPVQEGPD